MTAAADNVRKINRQLSIQLVTESVFITTYSSTIQ